MPEMPHETPAHHPAPHPERQLLEGAAQDAGLARDAADPTLIRGTCPVCGEVVVSGSWYVDGRGYLIIWRCVGSTCDYRRIL
jgi:hypothetical protein